MKWIKSFGRIRGKNFAEGKIIGLEEYLLDLNEIITLSGDLILEIGFGYGENLIWYAKNNSNQTFIGAEVYLNGISMVLKEIKEHNIKNIRLWNQDARILLEAAPDRAFSRILILFPDPWPKKRHNKRRIISEDFLKLLNQKLNVGGDSVIATDHNEYSIWLEEKIVNSRMFDFKKVSSEFLPVVTRYQSKANSKIHVYQLHHA